MFENKQFLADGHTLEDIELNQERDAENPVTTPAIGSSSVPSSAENGPKSQNLPTGTSKGIKLERCDDTDEEAPEVPVIKPILGCQPIPECNDPEQRLYKQWPGKNKFCLQGRLITGGENDLCIPSVSAPSLCAWICILVPSAIYFVLVAPEMWEHLNPALPIATSLIFLITILMLLCTCLTDPGILPRRDVVLASGNREQIKELLGFDLLGNTGNGTLTNLNDNEIESLVPPEKQAQGYRWCYTCKIIRPPRSSHCSACGNCVMRFDHHCPFVNNCVGQRNYRYFFGFTSLVFVLAIFVIASIFWYVMYSADDNDKKNQDPALKWVFIGFIILIAVAGLLVGSLWAYHTFLVCTGKTTKEHLKGTHVNSIDKKPTLTSKAGPSLFDGHQIVKAGYLDPRPKLPFFRFKRYSGYS